MLVGVGDDQERSSLPDHVSEAVGRVGHVDRQVRGTGLEDSQDRDRDISRARGGESDDASRDGARGDERARDGVGRRIEFGVREGATGAVSDRGPRAEPVSSRREEPGQSREIVSPDERQSSGTDRRDRRRHRIRDLGRGESGDAEVRGHCAADGGLRVDALRCEHTRGHGDLCVQGREENGTARPLERHGRGRQVSGRRDQVRCRRSSAPGSRQDFHSLTALGHV
ncbi:hypothetical protein GM1_002_01550 [Gordonia malaquae NBRC 108250]|uniref:Uncharacterized protein n=1 Tax=Gordonia malaquae NBRC 108250 TaxID=1223542 RepID=M3USF5_GORML|nr:hypothetical protein GM1_002_01550 [Gordonia malaquae NBRC 108250]